MSHIKTIEFYHPRKKQTYELEIDTEDPQNLVLETVTQLSGRPEEDIDPTDFEDDLEDDDWIKIEELVGEAK